jgi:AraC family transcriptional regulator, transcriptional activator of pobA
MAKVANINTISEYNNMSNQETLHPLVGVIDFSKTRPKKSLGAAALNFGFYAIFLKDDQHCEIRYGRNYYDYQEGTLVFIGPRQVVSIE